MAKTPKRSEALERYLADAYTDLQLRSLLHRCSDHVDLTHELPGLAATLSLDDLAGTVVSALQRHGMLDEAFFQRLKKDRPHRVAELDALQKLWGVSCETEAVEGRWSITLQATLADLDEKKLQSLLLWLRLLSDDVTLKIERVAVGSVILILHGTYFGYTTLRRAFLTAEVRSIARLEVVGIDWIRVDNPTTTTTDSVNPSDQTDSLLRHWIQGDSAAGCIWLDKMLPTDFDHSLLGQAIDDHKGLAPHISAEIRERAQRKLWTKYLSSMDSAVFSRLQKEDRLRPALTGGLDADHALLRRWRSGCQSAGKRLHQKHYRSLLRFIHSIVNDEQIAEDLASETFLDLIRQKTDVREFRALMYTIARFKVYAWFRGKKRHPEQAATLDISHLPDFKSARPDEWVVEQDDKLHLLRAIYALSESLQMALVLYLWEEMSASEIGYAFGWDQSNVRGKLRLGIVGVRRFLENPPPNVHHEQLPDDDLLAWFDALRTKARSYV